MPYGLRIFLILIFLIFLTPLDLWSQTKNQNTFVSQVDQSLTVRSVLVLPVEDNVSGIYAKPLTQHLQEVLSQDSQWTSSDFQNLKGWKLDFLYSNPKDVMKLARAANSDAILKTKISKGPSGINGKMTLFSGVDGLPLVEESVENLAKFEISEVNLTFEQALKSIKIRLPYRAEVLSRKGQDLTINAGTTAGMKVGSDVSIIQILKLNRHPKLKFIVSTEKEILGKAHLYKVEDNLSFAKLVMEREPGVVQVGTKVLSDEYIQYSEPYITEDGKILSDLGKRKEKNIAYGEKPEEWVPDHAPQFGKVDVMAGLTQYSQTAAFQSSGSIDGTNNIAPTISIAGEFWISPVLFAGLDLRSSAFAVPNNLPGSRPAVINMTANYYHVKFGYNFLLSPDFFGPRLQLTGGFAKFSSQASDTSPLTFTSMQFGGPVVGFVAQIPLGEALPTDVGARFNYYFTRSVTESPSSGSNGNVRINDFAFFLNHHINSKMSYIGELRFESYTADFADGPRVQQVNSISHKLTTFLFGVEFLF